MLQTFNARIAIKRLVKSGEKTEFTTVQTGVNAYINQAQTEIVQGFGNEASFFAFRMMTDGNHEAITVGDSILDDSGNEYTVRGVADFSSFVGKHKQFDLIKAYT